MRTLLAAPIVVGFATAGCAYPVAGADPPGRTHRLELHPPQSCSGRLGSRWARWTPPKPATGTAKRRRILGPDRRLPGNGRGPDATLVSAELRQIHVIAERPDVPG